MIVDSVDRIAMGLASFGWWASRLHVMQRIDSWLMETIISGAAVAMVGVGLPDHNERVLTAAWVLVAVRRAVTFSGHGNLLLPSIAFEHLAIGTPRCPSAVVVRSGVTLLVLVGSF
jgi:hypothetical protein